MNVCFHHSERARNGKLLSNVRNLLDDETVEADAVAVVASGEGIELLLADADEREAVTDLLERGVSFEGCGNTLGRSDIGQDDLIDGVEIVSSGVGELARLQEQGYGYVRP